MNSSERLLIDRRTLELVRAYVPEPRALEKMRDYFAVLADGTRLKILSALSISEMCVTDISLSLGIHQTTVSHQLRTLRTIGAVQMRRQGKVSFYSLRDKGLLDILSAAVDRI